MKTYGKLNWAIAGGSIPFLCNGREPEFLSHDKIAVVNTSDKEAILELVLFYEDGQPVENYKVKIGAKRLRKIRFNDLIDPEAMQMERNYGCLIKSTVPVIVQFSKMNTGAKANAEMATTAFPIGGYGG